MNRGPSAGDRSVVTIGLRAAPTLRLLDRPEHSSIGAGSCRVRLRTQELRQPLEIQDPADQQRLLPDAWQSPPTEAAQPVPVLAFPEEFLDQLPAPLRQLVAAATLAHAHPRMGLGAAAGLGRDVRRDAAGKQGREEVLVKEPL